MPFNAQNLIYNASMSLISNKSKKNVIMLLIISGKVQNLEQSGRRTIKRNRKV